MYLRLTLNCNLAETPSTEGGVETEGGTAEMTRRVLPIALAALFLFHLSEAYGSEAYGSEAYGQRRDELRDRQGRLLGTIVHRRDGTREARDRQGRLAATYHPKSNETRDRTGKLLTKGESLAAFLFETAPGG